MFNHFTMFPIEILSGCLNAVQFQQKMDLQRVAALVTRKNNKQLTKEAIQQVRQHLIQSSNKRKQISKTLHYIINSYKQCEQQEEIETKLISKNQNTPLLYHNEEIIQNQQMNQLITDIIQQFSKDYHRFSVHFDSKQKTLEQQETDTFNAVFQPLLMGQHTFPFIINCIQDKEVNQQFKDLQIINNNQNLNITNLLQLKDENALYYLKHYDNQNAKRLDIQNFVKYHYLKQIFNVQQNDDYVINIFLDNIVQRGIKQMFTQFCNQQAQMKQFDNKMLVCPTCKYFKQICQFNVIQPARIQFNYKNCGQCKNKINMNDNTYGKIVNIIDDVKHLQIICNACYNKEENQQHCIRLYFAW